MTPSFVVRLRNGCDFFADVVSSISYGNRLKNCILSACGARLERFEAVTDEFREAAWNTASDLESNEHLSASDENSR
jgi:hypothetical protein